MDGNVALAARQVFTLTRDMDVPSTQALVVKFRVLIESRSCPSLADPALDTGTNV